MLPMVDILGSIDNYIENCEQQIKSINNYISLLFRKLAFSASFCKLGDICSVITKGTTPTTINKSFVNKGVPFIKVESLTDTHQVDLSKIAFIDNETHALLQRSQLLPNDLLVSIAGTIGRFALLPKEIKTANTNQAVALLRGSSVTQEYLYALFLSGLCIEQIKAKTVQAVQANLSLSVISSLIVPHIKDKEFDNILENLCQKISQLSSKIKLLTHIKDQYLQKFFG